jgi:hypothetical protein
MWQMPAIFGELPPVHRMLESTVFRLDYQNKRALDNSRNSINL